MGAITRENLIPRTDPSASGRAKAVYGAGLLAAGACLVATFRDVDLGRAWGEVALLGPAVLLAYVPYGVSVLLDGPTTSRWCARPLAKAWGWR